MMMKKISRKVVYRSRNCKFTLVSDKVALPNRIIYQYDSVIHGGDVGIVGTVGKKVVMIRQHRYPVDKFTLEIPRGFINKGESMHACAAREMEEEAGYMPRELKKLITCYPAPGFSNEVTHIFFASSLAKTKSKPDDTEFLQTKLLDIRKAIKFVRNSKIQDAITVIGLLTARERGLI